MATESRDHGKARRENSIRRSGGYRTSSSRSSRPTGETDGGETDNRRQGSHNGPWNRCPNHRRQDRPKNRSRTSTPRRQGRHRTPTPNGLSCCPTDRVNRSGHQNREQIRSPTRRECNPCVNQPRRCRTRKTRRTAKTRMKNRGLHRGLSPITKNRPRHLTRSPQTSRINGRNRRPPGIRGPPDQNAYPSGNRNESLVVRHIKIFG